MVWYSLVYDVWLCVYDLSIVGDDYVVFGLIVEFVDGQVECCLVLFDQFCVKSFVVGGDGVQVYGLVFFWFFELVYYFQCGGWNEGVVDFMVCQQLKSSFGGEFFELVGNYWYIKIKGWYQDIEQVVNLGLVGWGLDLIVWLVEKVVVYFDVWKVVEQNFVVMQGVFGLVGGF